LTKILVVNDPAVLSLIECELKLN